VLYKKGKLRQKASYKNGVAAGGCGEGERNYLLWSKEALVVALLSFLLVG
jgi:hypothetical protein